MTWSDNDTAKADNTEMLFDLYATHHSRGDGLVEKDLPLDRAAEIAEAGGVENARFRLECAFADVICVDIQRPDTNPEMLVPHDWS